MIAQTTIKMQKQQWQHELVSAFTSLDELLKFCEVAPSDLNIAPEATKDFRLFVTKSWANRIKKGDKNDKLLLQVIPQAYELEAKPGYSLEPLQEKEQSPIAGLIHKYHGRVLLTLAGQCAINCRYCFRRNFPYQTNQFNKKNWQNILDYIKNDNSIYEVILSGGDPLIMPDKILKQVSEDIEKINHIKYLRVHSRIPIALPSRITKDLVSIFKDSKLTVSVVIHTNCEEELCDEVIAKIQMLKSSNIQLFNQSVLLKGINDNAKTLANLSHKLIQVGVIPYYLHRLDKVMGSAHFSVSEIDEAKIYRELIAILPGYMVPKLVEEIPMKKSKIPVKVEL